MAPVAASIPQATISRRFNTETALNVLSIYINTGVYPSFSPFTILGEKPLFTLTGNGNVTSRYFLPSTSSLSALSIFDSKTIFLRLPQNIVAQLLNSMQIAHIMNTFLIALILINFHGAKIQEYFWKDSSVLKKQCCASIIIHWLHFFACLLHLPHLQPVRACLFQGGDGFSVDGMHELRHDFR